MIDFIRKHKDALVLLAVAYTSTNILEIRCNFWAQAIMDDQSHAWQINTGAECLCADDAANEPSRNPWRILVFSAADISELKLTISCSLSVDEAVIKCLESQWDPTCLFLRFEKFQCCWFLHAVYLFKHVAKIACFIFRWNNPQKTVWKVGRKPVYLRFQWQVQTLQQPGEARCWACRRARKRACIC